MAGDNTQLNRYARAINKLFSVTAINISYRLAPANTFPVAPNDAWDSLKWIVANQKPLNIDLDAGFVIGGVSAGANLSAVCSQKWLSEDCSPPITGTLLLIPLLLREEIVPKEYKHLWLADAQNAQAPFFNGANVVKAIDAYEPDLNSPDFSPFNANGAHVGLPRTYISVCGLDPLRDDGLIYYQVLRERGVETRLDIYPGVPHGHLRIPQLKSAQKSFRDFLDAVGWTLRDERAPVEVDEVISSLSF